MASKSRRLYVGMTNFLTTRVGQHKSLTYDSFTKQYKIIRLVYFEHFTYVNNCIAREKQIKSWTRAKKVVLIGQVNPTWVDLAETSVRPVGKVSVTTTFVAVDGPRLATVTV